MKLLSDMKNQDSLKVQVNDATDWEKWCKEHHIKIEGSGEVHENRSNEGRNR